MVKNNTNTKWIWLSALLLFVCVASTTMVVTNRLNGFLLDDSGAISLIPEHATDNSASEGTTPQAAQPSVIPNDAAAPITQTDPVTTPGFEVSDDRTVWSTTTQVDIFRVSYKNDQQVITVNSGTDDKIIAPGTENSYTFKLKNTGDVAMEYVVTVDAYFTPGHIVIPVTGRLSRYDGRWVVGDQDTYVDMATLNTARDRDFLGAYKYTYYTLDWRWPFESGDDQLDTWLGNLADGQDMTLTIVINTTGTEYSELDLQTGITPPQTGDNALLSLWFALLISSFVLILILIFYKVKDRQREDTEAEQVEHEDPDTT